MNIQEQQLIQKIAQEFWAGRIHTLRSSALSVPRAVQGENNFHTTDLPLALTNRINDLCNHSPLLIYAFYSAGFALLLRRYFQVPAVCWGSTAFHLSDGDTFDAPFPLIHALRFEQEISSFKELFSENKEQLLKAYKYQNETFFSSPESLPESLLHTLKAVGFLMEGITAGDDSTFFDTTFSVKQSGENWRFEINAAPGFLDKQILPFFAASFVQALQQAVETPYSPLQALDLISIAEKDLLIKGFNATARERTGQDTLVSLFKKQVLQTPEAAAIIFEGNSLKYREVDHLSNQLSWYLLENDIEHGALVGIQLDRGPWMAISMLAILKAGAAYVPIDPEFPQERIDYIRADSHCKVVIDEALLADFLSLKNNYQTEAPEITVHAGDLAYVLYTSGSTGKPKGCKLLHGGVVNRIDWMWHELEFKPGEVVLQKTTFTFDVSVWEFFLPLCWGNTMVICSKEDTYSPDRLVALIEAHQVITLHFVPSMFKAFLTELEQSGTRQRIRSLDRVIASGEALSPADADRWYQLSDAPLFNLYGPTEASIDVTWYHTQRGDREIPIGRPIWNTEIYVLDEQQRLLPIGVPGEICIGGIGLSLGYLNRPELTAEKFIDHPFQSGRKLYRTGDLGKWRADGELIYLGRFDHQVKIRGFRIELGEIENALLSHPDVGHAVAVARETADGDKQLVAYYVSENAISVAVLQAHLGKTLPDYMIPSFFVHLAEMPQTDSGKVDRKALPAPDAVNALRQAPYASPTSDTEAVLVKIWQDVLGIEKVGILDNFFALGGDSIKAIQVVSRLRSFDFSVSVGKMLQFPVLSALAAEVRPITEKIDQSPVQGAVVLNPIQRQFFAGAPVEPGYFNQSVLLKSRVALDPVDIKKALEYLVAHHDALRMVFQQKEGEWYQYNRGIDEGAAYRIEYFDLSAESDGYDLLVEQANKMQGAVDLAQGPLVRTGIFRLREGDYLFIVIHHLVVDGVSWRILLEDLKTLLNQISEGATLSLPAKTYSFQTFASLQSEIARSQTIEDQRMYWEQVDEAEVPEIPADFEDKENRVLNAAEITVQWNAATTQALGHVNAIYYTDFNDLLLAALLEALQEMSGNNRYRIFMEGHGREAAGKDLDVTRTVGWFTTVYPVLFDLTENAAAGSTLVAVKETLRNIPLKGSGYGLLKYMYPGRNSGQRKPMEILFNYLGEIVSDAPQSLFDYCNEPRIQDISLQRERQSVIELNGMIVNGVLEVRLSYGAKQFRQETMTRLCRSMERYLLELAAKTAGIGERIKTPADFTYKTIAVKDLAAMTATLGPIEDVYPLSPLQEGIYFHWLKNPSPGLYLEQFSYRLKGKLAVEYLKKSYEQLVQRHAILRTCFRNDAGDIPLQFVCENISPQFNLIDLTAANTDAEAFIRNYKLADKNTGFDLSKGSQMRLSLIKIEEDVFECIWSHHHIILDGWSYSILMSEFFGMYHDLVSGHTPVLQAVSAYSGYIKWLYQLDLSQTHAYWKNYLNGYDSLASLPKQLLTDTSGAFNRVRESVQIPAKEFAALQNLAAQNGITQNIIFNGLWGIILSRLNNSNDVVFGSVVSGRPSELQGIENMLGLFINTIPSRVRYDGQTTLLGLLKTLHQNSLEGERFHYAQLAEVQSQISSGSPLFDHFLLYQNYPVEEIIRKENAFKQEVEISSADMYEQTNFDIIVLAIPGDELEIRFDFNSNVYAPDMIRRIGQYYKKLVTALIANPVQTIANVDMLPPEETSLLLTGFNDTAHAYPSGKTLIDLFEKIVQESPEKTAIVFEEKEWTFSAVNDRANRLANFLLHDIGLQKGQSVGIFQGRNEHLPVSLMAVLKAGGAYVPLETGYPEDRLRYMLEDAGIEVLLTEEKCLDYAKRLQSESKFARHLICVDQSEPAGPVAPVSGGQHKYRYNECHFGAQSHLNPERTVNCSDLAYILYTSGSTGKPKACMLEHGGVVNRIDWMWHALGFQRDEVVLQKTTFTFDVSVWEFFLPLCWGNKMVVCAKEDIASPDRLIALIANHRVNTIHFVPSMFKAFLAALEDKPGAEQALGSLKRVITSGEALPPETVRQWYRRMQAPVHNLYGPTEASIDVSYFTTDKTNARVPIGKPIWNTSLYILGQQQELLPLGAPGEICIGGIGLARGYLNRAALTAEKFIPNPFQPGTRLYRTGDLGQWLPDGNILYLGRLDDQVKVRGYRIELGEIENALEQHPQISASALLALENEAGEKNLVAYYTGDTAVAPDELRQHLGALLPAYMIPAFFVWLETLPLTTSGKVNRKALPDFREYLQPAGPAEGPGTPLEEQIATIWQQILGLEQIGVGINFFNTGGDSIKALRLLTQVNRTFGLGLSIAELYENPTIRTLATLVETAQPQNEAGRTQAVLDEILDIKNRVLQSLNEAEAAAVEDVYPLSEIEKGMVFETTVSENPGTFHDQFLFETGYKNFDPDKALAALQLLAEKHPRLRTLYNLNDYPEEVNILYKSVPVRIDLIDISGKSKTEQEQFIRDYLAADLGLFKKNLSGGVLWKLSVAVIGTDRQIFIWQFHNAILDGWSTASFLTELNNVYTALEPGNPPVLAPLSATHKDFVVGEICNKRDNRFKEYWAKELDGYKRLDIFSPAPVDEDYHIDLGTEFYRRVADAARQFDTHVQSLCFLAYLYVLKSLTYEQDITAGLVSNNRPVTEDGDKILGCFLNTLPFRIQRWKDCTWADLIKTVHHRIVENHRHQLSLLEIRKAVSGEDGSGQNPFFDTYFNYTDFHIYDDFQQKNETEVKSGLELTGKERTNTYLDFTVSIMDQSMHVGVAYLRNLACGMTIERFVESYIRVLNQIVGHPYALLNSDYLEPNDRAQLLETWQGEKMPFPASETLSQLFENQARRNPDATAIVDANGAITYKELDERSNRLAKLLFHKTHPVKEQKVGILHSRGIGMMTAILGILKSGGAYVPLDPDNPEDRLLFILEDAGIETLITEKAQAEYANRLQWRSKTLKNLICIDSDHFYHEFSGFNNELMSKDLWDYVGKSSKDAITGGGWKSSYTGEDMSEAEMQEYTQNVLIKLKPYLHPQIKVLEIGCSSGLTLFELAPLVGEYHGVDMSPVILEKTAGEISRRGITNVRLSCQAAHELHQLPEGDFDLIIINSVVQYFNGHNYLRDVIGKATAKLKDKGHVFLGDLMDEDKRDILVADVRAFKLENEGKGFRTKTEWNSELFVSRDFLTDLATGHSDITSVICSDKTGVIENELKRFRFDALLSVDKNQTPPNRPKYKNQFDLGDLNSFDETPLKIDLNPTDLCYVIYTSGSTGKPKGCLLEHRGVINRIEWQWQALGFQPGETVLQKTTFSFDVSVWEIFLPLCWGNKMVICTAEDTYAPHQILDLLETHQISTLHFVPSMLKAFLEVLTSDRALVKKMDSVKRIITSGEALTLESVKQWYQLTGIPLHNLYGPTEASIDVTFFPTGKSDEVIPIGKPVWNTDIYILGAEQELLPPGVPGEICIGGVGLARGYLNRPELTDQKFVRNPFKQKEKIYRTGDLGRWNENGEVIYLGRFDSQVKIRGYRIELGEIENVLESYSPVTAAAVITQTNDSGEKDLYAYYSGKEALPLEKLRSHLAVHLPAYMIPAHFIFLPELPLTTSGKVDKKILPSFTGELPDEADYLPPANVAQESMEKIWRKVLGLKRIGMTADFFAIGGDSIKALRLLTQVNKTFKTNLRVANLYEKGTIAGLVDLIAANTESQEENYDAILQTFHSIAREVQYALPTVDLEDAYPMSDVEKGMVLISLLAPEEAVYHNQFLYEVHIPSFNPEIFSRALAQLVDKHPKLRASYNVYDFSEPVCLIHRSVPVQIDYEDMTGLDAEARQNFIQEYLEQERQKKFEPHLPALWRMTVFGANNDDKKIILWQFHHAILDGWGSAAFITELSNVYQSLEADHNYRAPALPISYKDYIAYEISNNKNRKNIDFWKKELEDYVPLDIFTDEATDKMASRKFGLNHYTRLKRLAADNKTTVYNICFTAYLFTLKRLSYESDLTIGLVTDNRPLLENADRLLGCFVKAIPFRHIFDEGDSWNTLVDKVEQKSKLLKQFPLTLFEIKNQVAPVGNGGNPFYDTLFNFMDFHVFNEATPGIDAAETEQEQELTAEIDGYDRGNTYLDIYININNDNFGVYIKQWRKLRNGIPAEAILDEYCNVLNTMMVAFQEPIVPEDFRFGIAGTEYPAPASGTEQPESHLIDLFGRQVNQNPETVALCFGAITLRYRELDALSSRFGQYLRTEYLVDSEDAVCIKMERNHWYIVAMLGVLKAGGAYVPLDPGYPRERLDYIRSDSASKLIVDENVLSQFIARQNEFSPEPPAATIRPHNLAYIIYTSGTTGKPKGVMVEHRNVCRFLEQVPVSFGWNGYKRIGCATNFTFDISVLEIFGSLCLGKELFLYASETAMNPEKFLEVTSQNNVDAIQVTPSKLQQLMQVTEALPKNLKGILVGGEALEEQQYQWLKRQPDIQSINVYGPTETTIWSTALQLNQSRALSVGKALPGEFVFILDKQGYRAPQGVEGEICIGGTGVSRGYRNKPGLSAERFVSLKNGIKVYKTGDMGRILPDGNIEFLGRKDNQVKIRGHRIELGEIENTLKQHPDIVQAAAIIRGADSGNRIIEAFIQVKNAMRINDLYEFLGNYLPEYMFPSRFIEIDSFPLNTSGKLDRKALEHLKGNTITSGAAYEPPSNETEQMLVSIWMEVLGAGQIGVADNFFLLGGHSLNVMQMIGKINRTFNCRLSIENIFEEPTIRSIADEIARLRVMETGLEEQYDSSSITITI